MSASTAAQVRPAPDGQPAVPALLGMGKPDISVVVPTYNGQASLRELTHRVAQTLERMGLNWELLLIDDASPDDTPLLGPQLQQAHGQVRYVRLTQNVGQHRATVIGLQMAKGRVVVTMDDDLQQPPEAIPKLLAGLKPGVQVVIGRFDRSAHAFWRRLASSLLAWTLFRRADAPPLAITSFKVFRQEAAAQVVAQVPQGSFYLARVIQNCLPPTSLVNVSVPHHRRVHGHSNYGPRRLLLMAWGALCSKVARRRRSG